MPRQAARRLAKGRVCRAPEALRGHSITLVDGGVLDIAPDGRCVLAGVGARPGRGPRVEALSLHLALRRIFSCCHLKKGPSYLAPAPTAFRPRPKGSAIQPTITMVCRVR